MISRYSQIQQQVQNLSATLGNSPGHVQKIYSTAWYLCLQIRLPGKTFYLYLGRGGGHEGLWLSETPTPAGLRVRDTWLEWCRKNLTSALLVGAEMDPLDRAVKLRFGRGGSVNDFYLLWAGRMSYFAYYEAANEKWFIPWGGEGAKEFEIFNQVGRKEHPPEGPTSAPLPSVEELLKLEVAQLAKQRSPKAKLKSLKVKIGKIEGDLLKIRSWPQFQQWISDCDPEALETQREVTFGELRYKFPEALSAWQKRDWLFQQVKRLKFAEIKQAERLAEAQASLVKLETSTAVEESNLKPIRPVWKSVNSAKPAVKTMEEDYLIHLFEDCRIGLGRSAHGNDQLRKVWATGEDWWVHVAHGTSAHAIIKLARVGQPSVQQIQQAALLIAKHSGSTASQIEVIITTVKNLRGVTGAPGMVTYKKHKTLLCDVSEGSRS